MPGPFDTPTPFDGNLLPPGANGGSMMVKPNGSQHVNIFADGAHVSYDRNGGQVGGVHATIHDVKDGSQKIIAGPRR